MRAPSKNRLARGAGSHVVRGRNGRHEARVPLRYSWRAPLLTTIEIFIINSARGLCLYIKVRPAARTSSYIGQTEAMLKPSWINEGKPPLLVERAGGRAPGQNAGALLALRRAEGRAMLAEMLSRVGALL